jgi:hypothetical protein
MRKGIGRKAAPRYNDNRRKHGVRLRLVFGQRLCVLCFERVDFLGDRTDLVEGFSPLLLQGFELGPFTGELALYPSAGLDSVHGSLPGFSGSE